MFFSFLLFTSNKVGYCCKFNPDEDKQHLFVTGMADKKILCWDIRSGEIVQVSNFLSADRKLATSLVKEKNKILSLSPLVHAEGKVLDW